jgi:transposase
VINEKLDLLELLLTKIRNVEKIIEEKYGKDEDVQLMLTVSSIGLVTAAVVKAEIGDMSKFETGENLAAYVGVSPTTSQSGEKTWGDRPAMGTI